ncbi:MAG TPA: hypothetical protein VF170_18435, partial [Planctomycetaceae bacterium]
ITAVLVGKLTKNKKSSLSNGPSLDVAVPVLAAGGIKTFKTTVKHGKYVQARCKTKSEKWQAITSYDNHAQTTDDYVSKCKQK